MKFQFLTQACVTVLLAVVPMPFANCQTGFGTLSANEESVLEKIESHLQFGEFCRAIELARDLPKQVLDEQLANIAVRQSQSGNTSAAVDLLDTISNDRIRYLALFQRGFGPVSYTHLTLPTKA